MTQFDVMAWKQFQAGQKQNLNPALNTTGSLNAGTASSSPSGNGSSIFSSANPGAPPPPPDFKSLTAAGNPQFLTDAIKKSASDFDALSASTAAQGFQSANSAGASYASRLMQQGINPVASGVVAAQAKLPVYKQLAEINKDKNSQQLDYQVKAASLAANIAQTVAQLQMSYSQTLADFNIKKAGLAQSGQQIANQNAYQQGSLGIERGKLDLSKQQLGLSQQELNMNQQLNAAKIANLNADTTGRVNEFPAQQSIVGAIKKKVTPQGLPSWLTNSSQPTSQFTSASIWG